MSNQNILQRIASPDNLRDAWGKLNKSNADSHGISNETIAKFRNNFEDKIKSISERLLNDRYRFKPYRPVLIPKKQKGKYRPLQIPEIEDRIVCKALALEIEKQWKDTLDECRCVSFAYQKNLGTREAVERIKKLYCEGYRFAFESDIENFFTEVNKSVVVDIVLKKLSDTSIDNILKSALDVTIASLDKIKPEQREYFSNVANGIPQGNPLSPLLANIYLIPFDKYFISKDYNLVRYADDFVILSKTKEDCHKIHLDCLNILNHPNINLKIHPLQDDNTGKTRIVDIRKESITFLSITFDGKYLFPSRDNVDKLKESISELCSGRFNYSVSDILTKLSNKLDGWTSAFFYTNGINRYAEELDYHINRHLYLSLYKLGWKFAKSSLKRVPYKYPLEGKSRFCLSSEQRNVSGVPKCMNLVNKKRETEANKAIVHSQNSK